MLGKMSLKAIIEDTSRPSKIQHKLIQAWIQLRNSGGVRWREAPPKEPWRAIIDVDGCFH